MAGLLDGLFGRGGGGGDDLYGDLLDEKQRAALSGRGLLSMAGAFADMAMPRDTKIPIGAVLGKAAQALGAGRDEAANTAFKAMYYGEQARGLRSKTGLQQKFFDDIMSKPLAQLMAEWGGGPSTASPATAAPEGGAAPAPSAPAPPGMGGPLAALPPELSGQGPLGINTSLGGPLAPPAGDPALGATAPTSGGFGVGGPLAPRPTLPPGSQGASLAPGGLLGGAPLAGPDELLTAGAPPFAGGMPPVQQAAATGRDPLDIIKQYESGGRNIMQQVVPPGGGYNPSVGRVTGPSTAQGPWQITNTTWKETAPKVGIDPEKYPNAMSVPEEVQRVVAQKLYDEQGYAPWAPYNKALANAVGWTGGSGEDTVVGQRGGVPGVMRAQYSPGGGAPAAGAPAVPLPPGVDGAKMQALLLELAKRNAGAQVLGLGSPYGDMLSVLQGSPAYKAAIELEQRKAVYPMLRPEAEQRTLGERTITHPLDKLMEEHRSVLRKSEKEAEQLGAAANDLTDIRVPDGKGGQMVVPGTRAQAVMAANGLAVPELGIPARLPAPGQQGSAITPPNATPYYTKEDEVWQAQDAKTFEAKRQTAETARASIQNANDMRQLIERGVIAGASADTRTQILKLGQLLKLTGKDDNDLIRNTEAYIARAGKELKQGLEGLGPPVSNVDIGIAQQIAGGQNLTVEGMKQLMEIQEKYSRQNLDNFNRMAKTAPPGRFDRAVLEPPTYGAATITGPKGERMWNKNGQWVPF